MRRREIMTLVGGAAVGWLHRAVAQQTDRMRRIGVLLPYAQNDLEAKSHLSAFTQQLERLGWLEGHNIRIDARFAAGNADQYAVLATELAALQPDVQSRHPRPPRYSTRRGRFR